MNWSCPGIDTHFLPPEVYELEFDVLSSSQELLRILPLIASYNLEEYDVLPVIQSQEACILGAPMAKKANCWVPGIYPFSAPEELYQHLCEKKKGFLRDDPRSKAMVEVIRESADRKIVVEVQAPFSVLTALLPPEKVFASIRRKKDGCITSILDRILEELILYLTSFLEAGCKVISLADPLGKRSLCGPQIYKNWIAPWEKKLLVQCHGSLEHALFHICGNMAMDLVNNESALIEQLVFDPNLSYLENLYQIAEDPSISFIGPGCLRNTRKTPVGFQLILKNAEE